MFSASIGRDGRRRWSGLLVVDAFVVVLAVLDLGVGVLHEIQHGKPAAGAALTGLFGGTSATVYFGALCLCWDEGPSPRRILLALASCIALVGTTLLGAQQCMDAPRVVASCSFLAFAALRLCGGRAFELAGPAGSGTAAPALPGAADGLVPQRPSHPIMRHQVEAEISRIYQQAAPGKVHQAAHLIRRYPPEQWHQMLRMIGYKYGQAIDAAVLANTAAMCPTYARGTEEGLFEASSQLQSSHNRIGRALALLLPVCAIMLFDGQLDATDGVLNHSLRAVSFLTGPHYGSPRELLPEHTIAQLRALYPQLLPTPTAVSRPTEEWIEVQRSEERVRSPSSWNGKEDVGDAVLYPINIRLLTPSAESAVSRRLFQSVDSNADGTIYPAELDAWRKDHGDSTGTDVTAERTRGQRPLLIWFPWSTLVLGGSAMDAGNGLAEALADALDVVVAVVDVGLAPERGYPHSTEAGLDAVEWLLRQVHQARGQVGGLVPTPLHVDPKRIMIGGAGGGGAVAASIALSDEARARLRRYTNTGRGGDDRVFESCLLITPMLGCPNQTALDNTRLAGSGFKWNGSKAHAELVGATVMSSAQVDWGWEMYARGHPGGVVGCASSVECSPSSATESQLKAAQFEHLVLLTASQDALLDEGANFAGRLAAAMTEGRRGDVHHIRAEGSHVGAPLYDTVAWAQLIASVNRILQR